MIKIYTDGASRGNPGLSACGFKCIDNKLSEFDKVWVFRKSTNNRMEVGAIIAAMKYAKSRSWLSEDIQIMSDSAWAIGAISKNWNITENLDLVNKARNYLSEFSNLKFIKVKGHSDNEGNIAIDFLLNEAMNHPVSLYIDKDYERSLNE